MIKVFSQDWFKKHQKPVLRLLNNRFAQAYLGIPKEKYVKASRGALVHRKGKKNVLVAYSYDYVADKLYNKFKPFWYTIHFWDWATQWKPEWNFGFDTLTEYTNGSNHKDFMAGRGSVDETISAISTGSGTFYGDNNQDSLAIQTSTTTDQFKQLNRFFMSFDTSTIETDDTITSVDARIRISNTFGTITLGTPDLDISTWTSTQYDTPRFATYQEAGKTALASSALADGYHTFSVADTSVTKEGTTGYSVLFNWDLDESFTGTWTSLRSVSCKVFSYTYGTSSGPRLTVEYDETVAGTLDAELEAEPTLQGEATHYGTLNAELELDANLSVILQEAQTIEKTFIYRVYDKDGNYVGQWNDVSSEPNWAQRINTPGASMEVLLSRSPLNKKRTYQNWEDDTNDPITDDGSDQYIFPDDTEYTVGSGTDVDLGLFVDVYVFYGSLEQWIDDGSDPMTDDTGDFYLFGLGSPAGKKIFAGKIDQYNLIYGETGGVEVSLISRGHDMSQRIIKDGSDTSVTYSSQDPGAILRDVLDNYGGDMTYTTDTLELTSTTVSYEFRLNTALEGANKCVQLAPDGWYWYGDVGTNEVHMHDTGTTADHTFKLGKEIHSLELRRTLRNLVNEVYFVGGETAGVPLYKTYSDATSQTNYGKALEIIVDQRVTDATTANTISNNLITDQKNPEYTSTIVIPDIVYDIYTIKLGEIIGFSGFGNFVDDLTMQVAEIMYSKNQVTLTLGSNLEEQSKRIEDINRNLKDKETENIADAPS